MDGTLIFPLSNRKMQNTDDNGRIYIKQVGDIQARSFFSEGERLLSANCCLTAHRGSDYVNEFWLKRRSRDTSTVLINNPKADLYSNVECRLHTVLLHITQMILIKIMLSKSRFLKPNNLTVFGTLSHSSHCIIVGKETWIWLLLHILIQQHWHTHCNWANLVKAWVWAWKSPVATVPPAITVLTYSSDGFYMLTYWPSLCYSD